MYILVFCTILCTIILFIICYKKLDESSSMYDEKISPIIERIGDNEELGKAILKHVDNCTTIIEKNKEKNEKISYYNVNKDKIVIKDTEDLKDCFRLIHVSHECVHSLQSKKLLKLHYIFSNINILYFLAAFIYFFYNKNAEIKVTLLMIQIFVFIIAFMLKIITESDATYRAPQIAFDFLENMVDRETLNKFKKKIQSEISSVVPIFYFSLFWQGAILLIINQVAAILI